MVVDYTFIKPKCNDCLCCPANQEMSIFFLQKTTNADKLLLYEVHL